MAPNLTKLDPSTWKQRLEAAMQDRQAIIACGLDIYEREDLMKTLAASIPKESRVIVLVDKNGVSKPDLDDHLPRNRVFLIYNNNEPNVGFPQLVDAAQNMGGDYLMVYGLKSEDLPVFEVRVSPRFSGIIAALNVPIEHPMLKQMDGLVIDVVSEKMAAHGVNAIYSTSSR